jgi:glycosyltransferase involved in cell wall biosynthesis
VPGEPLVAGTMSRLSPEKGIEHLLRAVARLIGGDLDFRVAEKGRARVVLTVPADGGS